MARISEVENTMKEALEFVDKLQVDLDSANAANATLKNRAKISEDHVANLQQQVQELQSQAQESQATTERVVEIQFSGRYSQVFPIYQSASLLS